MLPYWESSVCPLANFDPSKDTFFDIGGRSISGKEPEIIVQSGSIIAAYVYAGSTASMNHRQPVSASI